ncbi:MotE family protein [Sulfitobacter sp.]|jgi:flagellar motility protein MotE (MotC chaperone)|uniref:MotE family protein n=1 Tax=Sulfitobacter sp. TaxID=1903071 RepID=UPI003001432A
MRLPNFFPTGVPAGRGSVTVIAALLLASATVRLITGATGAWAQSGQLPTNPMPSVQADSSAQMHEKTAEPSQKEIKTASASFNDRSDVSRLLQALNEREALVIKREKQLEMRMRALSVADTEIEKRLKILSDTEQTLRATLSLADEASEKDLLRLTTVYESMKPKDASKLFEEMEPNFAAGFLGRMRPDVAAQVMAGLSPQVAYSISVILAGRNATVPKT